MQRYLKKVMAILAVTSSIYGDFVPSGKESPWFTGSFFSTAGEVVPLGTFTMQWYLFVQQIYARYNRNYSLVSRPGALIATPEIQVQTGIAPKVDTQLTYSGIYNKTEGASDFALNDFQLQIGMQIYKTTLDSLIPDIRLTITESFPTGKFDEGDPKKEGTDIGGSGSFMTAIGMNLQNIFFLDTSHPTRMRLNIWVTIPTQVKVKGINFYIGEGNTKGKVRPGTNIEVIYSPEITLTRNWVFTFDLIYNHNFPSSFRGRLDAEPSENSILGAVDSFQFSPAVEYNFNANAGLLFGGWFTLIGKRSPAFAGGAFSMVYAW